MTRIIKEKKIRKFIIFTDKRQENNKNGCQEALKVWGKHKMISSKCAVQKRREVCTYVVPSKLKIRSTKGFEVGFSAFILRFSKPSDKKRWGSVFFFLNSMLM